MIDLDRETLLTPAQAVRYVPTRRGGRKVSRITVWKWMVHGHRGVYLDGLKQPGGWMTSKEALQRFFAALAEAERERKRPRERAMAGAVAAPAPIALAAEEAWAQTVLEGAKNWRRAQKG